MEVYLAQVRFEPATLGRQLWLVLSGIAKARGAGFVQSGTKAEQLLHEHLAHDDLVAWGWHPGEGRDPAPGSQALLGELIQAAPMRSRQQTRPRPQANTRPEKKTRNYRSWPSLLTACCCARRVGFIEPRLASPAPATVRRASDIGRSA